MKKLCLFIFLLFALLKLHAQVWNNLGSLYEFQANGNLSTMAVSTGTGHLYALNSDFFGHGLINLYKNIGTSFTSATGAGSWSFVAANSNVPGGNFNVQVFEPNLALDNNEVPYVAFKEASNKISVIKFNGTNWVYVGGAGFSTGAVAHCNMTIYNNTPYVVYSDNGLGGKITVQKFDGTNWITVGTAGFTNAGNDFASIKIGSDGRPVIIFRNIASNSLFCMKFNGSSWALVGSNTGFGTVAPNIGDNFNYFLNGPVVFPFKFALDNSNNPYVIFLNANSFKYPGYLPSIVHFNGNSWVSLDTKNPFSYFGENTWNYDITFARGFPYIVVPNYSPFTNNAGSAGDVLGYDGTNWNTTQSMFTINNPMFLTSAANGNIYLGGGNSVGNGTQGNLSFIENVAAPIISSFTPVTGGAGSSIVITGTNFTGATSVSFGGYAAASFTVNSPTQITAVPGNSGASGNVSVTTPGGSVSAKGFTYLPKPNPVITSFSPTHGILLDTISINGQNFTADVSSVTIGGVAVAFTRNSSTNISAYLVSASAGNSINLKSGSITVTTLGGGTATKTGFTFLKTPLQITFTAIPLRCMVARICQMKFLQIKI